MKEAIAPLAGKVRVFFMDEARFGQQGTTTRVWAPTNSRPTAVRQTRYEWVYLYAAVEPATGESVPLLAPNVNTGTFNVFLQMLSERTRSRWNTAVLIMDQAGWHKSQRLKMPDKITALLLPPYSPELNPAENLWHYLRSHYLANRAYRDYDHLLDAGTRLIALNQRSGQVRLPLRLHQRTAEVITIRISGRSTGHTSAKNVIGRRFACLKYLLDARSGRRRFLFLRCRFVLFQGFHHAWRPLSGRSGSDGYRQLQRSAGCGSGNRIGDHRDQSRSLLWRSRPSGGRSDHG